MDKTTPRAMNNDHPVAYEWARPDSLHVPVCWPASNDGFLNDALLFAEQFAVLNPELFA